MKRILVILTVLVWSLSACQNNCTIPFTDLTNFSTTDTTNAIQTSHAPLEIGIVYESMSGNVLVTGGLCTNPKCNCASEHTTHSHVYGSIETAELGITNEVIRCRCKHGCHSKLKKKP